MACARVQPDLEVACVAVQPQMEREEGKEGIYKRKIERGTK
jgi:hypothetical protein